MLNQGLDKFITNLDYCNRINKTPVAYKNSRFRVVAYWNVMEIYPIFAQKSPKKRTFEQKSGGSFEFNWIL